MSMRTPGVGCRFGLLLGVAMVVALTMAGCKTEELWEVPKPCKLKVRTADGSAPDALILVSVDTLPYHTLKKKTDTWKESKSVGLQLGTHTLVVRWPREVMRFGYKDVMRTDKWTITVVLPRPGSYTALLDPESAYVVVTADDDGARVDVEPPKGDPRARPEPANTNAPPIS